MSRSNSPAEAPRVGRNPLAADPALLAGVPNTEAHQRMAEAAQREITARVKDGAREDIPPLVPMHPLDTPEENAKYQRELRGLHEAQFPWYARWLRRVSRLPKTVYEFADSVDERFRIIHHGEQSQSLYNNEVAATLNQQATWLNGLREALREANARLAYYERMVPPIKRAKAEYDRERAGQLLRDADAANVAAAPANPVIPFDGNGVRLHRGVGEDQPLDRDTDRNE